MYKLSTIFLLCSCIMVNSCRVSDPYTPKSVLKNDSFRVSLPKEGRLENGKPVGSGWINLIASMDGWNYEKQNWHLDSGILHGDYYGGKLHSYAYTKNEFSDFELNAVVRMSGKEANSGVCIRTKPTDFDNVPGYQIDMGPGYWGCLWDERRDGMVVRYPTALADQLVNENQWNHYYIIARDHHIQAWLNGVKTIDTVHIKGIRDGAIGLQLCHGDKHTVIDVKLLSLRLLH